MKFYPLYFGLIFFILPFLGFSTATECEMNDQALPPSVTPLSPYVSIKEDATATEIELYQATLDAQQQKKN